MFANNTLICVHCGLRFPQDPKAKKSRSRMRGSGNRSYMKLILILLLIGAVYGLYSTYFKESDILSVDFSSSENLASGNLPSYMIHGSINLEKKIVKGKTNIVDFYSEYSSTCRDIAPLLKELDEKREDIAVIKIDINRRGVRTIDWQSPIARQFRLKSIPHFVIVTPSGRLKWQGKDAYDFVIQKLRVEGLA